MGRLFLVEFDQNPEITFYCCRVCRTHIALSQACTARMEGIRHGYFSQVVNLLSNEPCRSLVADELHCVKCNQHLGWGCIQLIPAHVRRVFLLKLGVLLFWNGQLFRNADQPMHPVRNQQG